MEVIFQIALICCIWLWNAVSSKLTWKDSVYHLLHVVLLKLVTEIRRSSVFFAPEIHVCCSSLTFSLFLFWNFFVLMQIAAKINPTGTSESVGQKRPLEDGSGMDWAGKLIYRPSLQPADIVLAICVKLINGNFLDITNALWNLCYMHSSCGIWI